MREVLLTACNPAVARELLRAAAGTTVDVVMLRKQAAALEPLVRRELAPTSRILVLDEPFFGCSNDATFTALIGFRGEDGYDRCTFPWGTFNANLFVLGAYLARDVRGANLHADTPGFEEFPLAGEGIAVAADELEERSRERFRAGLGEARAILTRHRTELVAANDGDLARSDTGLVDGFPAQIERAAMYASALPLEPGTRLLEVGSGAGWGAFALAPFAASTLALDLDADVVAFCASRLRRDGLRYECAELAALDLPGGAFDVVVAFELIEHLDAPLPFLREVRRVLAPGGRLVLSTPDHRRFAWRALTAEVRAQRPELAARTERELLDDGWCAPHVQAFTPESLAALCAEAGFASCDVRYPTYAPGRALARTAAAAAVPDALAALARSIDWDPFDFAHAPTLDPAFGSFSFVATARA